jgi:hypothetical protein
MLYSLTPRSREILVVQISGSSGPGFRFEFPYITKLILILNHDIFIVIFRAILIVFLWLLSERLAEGEMGDVLASD